MPQPMLVGSAAPSGATAASPGLAYNRGGYIEAAKARDWSSSAPVVALLLAVHVGLGLMMHRWPLVGTIHGWAVGLVALSAIFVAQPIQVATIAAYIAGADVLWRMNGAVVPWEFAKYLVAAMFIGTLIRRRGEFRWRPVPLLYFGLLIPSISVLLRDPTWDIPAIKNAVSFGLSGPLTIAMSIWFFSQLVLSPTDLRKILMSCVIAVAAIATLTLVSTYSAEAITWTGESNFVTSGGFGPNQISTVLGFGGLLGFLLCVEGRATRTLLGITACLTLLLLTQSAMTFSRGGLVSAVVAAALFSFSMHLMRRGAARGQARGLIVLMLLSAVLVEVILPRLDRFTGGALNSRLEETTLTGRGDLVRDDLKIWGENPILGIGPGALMRHRSEIAVASHTEYSRLLAEHGLLGALALATLVTLCTARVLRARDPRERALVIALLSWSFLTMAHAAMRTLAPGLMLGLAFARFTQSSVTPQMLRHPRADQRAQL